MKLNRFKAALKKYNVGKVLFILAAVYMLYVLAFGILPYASYLDVNDEFSQSTNVEQFYGTDQPSVDRAGIVEDGKDGFDARLRLIDSAKDTIEISCYATHWGDSTEYFMGALLDAADRGVHVRFIIDGVAHHLKRDAEAAAHALSIHPNIELKFYNEPMFLKPWTFNGRLHDKYLIADDKLLILGGRNIGDKYFDTEGYKKTLSLDRDVLVYNTAYDTDQVKESVIFSVKQYFEEIWNLDISKEPYRNLSAQHQRDAEAEAVRLKHKYAELKANKASLFNGSFDYMDVTVPTHKISFIHNPIHNGKKEPYVWYQISSLLLNAEDKVKIQSPYTVLNSSMRDTMTEIGSDLDEYTLLTNSLASTPNVAAFSSYVGERESIASTGVQLYEYQGEHSIHGKSYVVDDELSIVGSYNLDIRSTYINTEVMLVIHGEEFADLLEQQMDVYQAKSLLVNEQNKYEVNEDLAEREVSEFKRVGVGILSVLSPMYKFLL
ncbi:phospholipase D-like domain-containing protein [Paenibacillus marinisediminis]